MNPRDIRIRKAQCIEGPAITRVAMVSKAHWGYDQDFLDQCLPDLTIDAGYINNNPVYVAERHNTIIGFYSIIREDDGYYLDNMFVIPEFIGKGLGKQLWQDALVKFQEMGIFQFKLVADPYAAGFYAAMGAEQIAEKESQTFPGRKLPLMRYEIGQK